ncbi:hemicentin-1-like, partial [Actinia tenebrosa]|uniref:Hemicentin-1-like n=1 Tax=Actinia tenebrosa TaxID=6105 RepID=A0A6P8I291_ACTTE
MSIIYSTILFNNIAVPPTIIALICQGCQSGVAIENQTITLLCNATGKPVPNIRWMKNGEYYDGNSSSSSPMNKIVFQKFAISDTGIYTCIADNGVGNPGRKSFLLSVNYRPENTSIKISDEKKVFCKGDSIHVTCTSHAKPAPAYSLYRSNVFLGSNAIGIFVVELAENGNYSLTCIPNNKVGIGPSKSESVTVKEPPKITNGRINGSLSTNQPVVEGDVVTVTCSASGSPPLTGRWTKDGRVWNGNNLIFNPINRADAGSYKFILHNGDECNKTEQKIHISVYYLDLLEVIGSSNKSYSQSNPLVLFNLSINAYPSNTSLSCNPSAPNILTTITSHDAGINRKQYLVVAIIQNDLDSASIVCKAENSVGVRERTLHFYRQPIVLKEAFAGQFSITNPKWQDDLQDVKSAGYNDLKQKCIKILETAYSGVPYLAAINIKDFILQRKYAG